MRFLIRVILTLGVIAGVLLALITGLSLGTGVNVGDYVEIPGITQPSQTPTSTTGGNPLGAGASGAITDSSTVEFVWRGDQILYEGNPITEERFSELLSQANANGAPVEIRKASDVTVADADRWRRLLEDAQVQYEITLQE